MLFRLIQRIALVAPTREGITVNTMRCPAQLSHHAGFPSSGRGDEGESPATLSQIIVASVGSWRSEGLALLELVD
jgi:hypothetical protein